MRPTAADFMIAYAATDEFLRIQLIEPTLMIDPPPLRFMPGSTVWMAKKCGRRLIEAIQSKYAGSMLVKSWRSSLASPAVALHGWRLTVAEMKVGPLLVA